MVEYECHITCPMGQAAEAESVARELGWKTSQIARDPVLGDNTYFYLTRHSTNFLEIFAGMVAAAETLHYAKVKVIRKKIELVVYDEKPNG